MNRLEYEFGCAVKVNKDLSSEVTVIHRGCEKVFSHSDVRIIAPQNIQSFQTFINQHQNVDRDELNNLVKDPAFADVCKELSEILKRRMTEIGENIPEIREAP